MNADVAVTDTLATALNRHMAHMAESVIQRASASSSGAASTGAAAAQKSALIEECVSVSQSNQSKRNDFKTNKKMPQGQLMSLWRPIMCRGREFQTPPEPPQLLPLAPALPANNNNKTAHSSARASPFVGKTGDHAAHWPTSAAPASQLANSKCSESGAAF